MCTCALTAAMPVPPPTMPDIPVAEPPPPGPSNSAVVMVLLVVVVVPVVVATVVVVVIVSVVVVVVVGVDVVVVVVVVVVPVHSEFCMYTTWIGIVPLLQSVLARVSSPTPETRVLAEVKLALPVLKFDNSTILLPDISTTSTSSLEAYAIL